MRQEFRNARHKAYALWFDQVYGPLEDVPDSIYEDGRHYILTRAKVILFEFVQATFTLEELNATRIERQYQAPVGQGSSHR